MSKKPESENRGAWGSLDDFKSREKIYADRPGANEPISPQTREKKTNLVKDAILLFLEKNQPQTFTPHKIAKETGIDIRKIISNIAAIYKLPQIVKIPGEGGKPPEYGYKKIEE